MFCTNLPCDRSLFLWKVTRFSTQRVVQAAPSRPWTRVQAAGSILVLLRKTFDLANPSRGCRDPQNGARGAQGKAALSRWL